MRTLVAILSLAFLSACQPPNPTNPPTNQIFRISGSTMGSGYSISYTHSQQLPLQPQIETLLAEFNRQLSTYDSTSTISLINRSPSLPLGPNNKYLISCIQIAKTIHSQTNGYFNPALKPLVNYWGFGYKEKRPQHQANPTQIDSLLALTNFDDIQLQPTNQPDSFLLTKTNPLTQIEFNAMAPGLAADLIAQLLQQNNINNYLVEVGGEILAQGSLPNGQPWRVGINTPKDNADINDFQTIAELKNVALATSGNYRSFYESNGKKIVHTINPKTGYTEQNQLLSVSVFAPTCAEADAFATACMASGLDSAQAIIQRNPNISAYFIYLDSLRQPQERWLNNAKSYFPQ